MAKFEAYQDRSGGYRWRLKAGNGEIVAVSESYTTKASAIASAKNVQYWASGSTIVDLT